jgi:hypothetical protein
VRPIRPDSISLHPKNVSPIASPREVEDPVILEHESIRKGSSVFESDTSRTSLDSTGSRSDRKNRSTIIIYSPQRKELQTVISPVPLSSSGNSIPTEKTEISENVSLMYSERETETLKEIFTFIVTKQPR